MKFLSRKLFFFRPKFIKKAFLVVSCFAIVLVSFNHFLSPSQAFAAPWSPTHNQYGQRKQLTLVNNSGQTFESGTTYKISIDTQSLVNSGSVLTTCDDLRVVYQPNDTTATELKRNLEYSSTATGVSTCATSSATKVVFQLQANITNSSTDTNYYLYFDNPRATTYPAADALAAYNVGSKTATFVAPFNGTTTALAAGSGTPTTATGAIRYSGGKSALSFDGKSDYVQFGATNLDATKPFTVEFYAKSGIADGSRVFSWASLNNLRIDKFNGYRIHLPNGAEVHLSASSISTDNAWHHIAFVYDGSWLKGYLDGTLKNSTETTNNTAPGENTQFIGTWYGASSQVSMDEFRWSNIIRYTGSFTPQSNPFVRDEYTKLLLHFDENGDDPRNTGKAIDDSGNGNHGTITGAKYVGGFVGVDGSTTSNASTGYQSSQTYAGHDGVFIEEGTTNKITNPSFEHSTYSTSWSNDGNWWEAGGASGAVAAYQPVGASDLANSYVNKANPGTYDATTGVAPTWDAANGWTFNNSHWLKSSIPVPAVNTSQTWSALVRFSNANKSNYSNSLFGWHQNASPWDSFSVQTKAYSSQDATVAYGQGCILSASQLSAGVAGFAGGNAYLNGQYNCGMSSGTQSSSSFYIIIGGASNNSYNTAESWSLFVGKIQALSFYDETLTSDQVLAITNAMNTLGLTVTKNTTAPYYKFGSSSAKVLASADGTLTTIVNAGNTNTHTLSAYVYDGTTGNVGGTVGSSIASLVFNGTAQTTTYTDMGGGWWRLTYSGTGIASSQSFGVQVKSGKTVYVDGVQLEEKSYATTYTDGTMGTGYAWTGTANESTSTRTAENLQYASSDNITYTTGTVSLWVKPNWSQADGVSHSFFNDNFAVANSIFLQKTNGNVFSVVAYGSTSSGSKSYTFPSTLTKDTWTHVVFTYSSSGGITAGYINGSASGTPETSGIWTDMTSIGANFAVGTDAGNYYPSDSTISDFRVFNTALTSAEIADLYYSGLGSHSSLAPTATERFSDGQPPVLVWHLNEGYGTTAYDSTINQNSGTVSGATWSDDSGQAGMSGSKSLKFDGSNDSISRTYSNDSELAPGTNPFSISTWFKHPSTVSGTDTLISRYNGAGYKLYMNSSGYICFAVDDDSTWTPDDSACTTVSYADSTWHHVLAIKGNTTIAVYIDGTQKAITTFTVSGSLSGNGPTLYTGIDSDGTSNPWDGFIDEVRVYNSARSEEQINQEFVSRESVKGVSAQFGSGGAGDTLTQGLVVHWKMDEASANTCSGDSNDSCDSSGNAKDLLWDSSVVSIAGKYGNGTSYDGTDTSRVYADDTFTPISSSKRWTVSLWFKTSDTQGYLFDSRDIGLNYGGAGLYTDGSNTLKMFIENRDSGTYYKQYTYSVTATDNNWHHVLVTRNEDNSVKLFFDGIYQTPSALVTDTDITSYSETWTDIYFGHRYSANLYNFTGIIDEARVFNRALSPAEVRALYEYAPGPVAHYSFNEGSGQSAYDKSGNGNTVTLGASSSVGSDDPTWTNGKYGKALSFDGSNDFVSATANNLPANNKPQSISAWIYYTTTPSDANVVVLENDTSSVQLGFRSGGLAAVWKYGGTNLVSTTIPSAKTWHYYTYTFDGTTHNLFIDGENKNNTTTAPQTASPTSLQIGRYTGGQNFGGYIDDVRIYSYPRTQKQIIQDMNAGHPAVGSPVGSPVAYYKFDEGTDNRCAGGVNDVCNSGSAGSVLDGAQSGMSVPATSTSGWTNFGKFDKALNYDGSDDKVSVSDSDALDITGNITISAWVNPTDFSNYREIVSKGSTNCSSNCPFNLYVGKTGDGAGSVNFIRANAGYYHVRSTNILQAGAWNHVLVTDNGVGFSIYINGVKSTTTVMYGSYLVPIANSASMNIGLRADSSTKMLGTLDELRIYNYALSDDEVKLEYNQGKIVVMGNTGTSSDGKTGDNSASRAYCPPGNTEGNCAVGQNPAPVAEWNFDEGSGQSTSDISGNANTGTLGSGGNADSADPTWAPGKIGKALSFDGTDDYVDLSPLASPPSTAITVSAWVKPSSFKDYARFVSRGRVSCGSPYVNVYLGTWDTYGASTTKTPRFAVGAGGALKQTSRAANYQLQKNTWSYIVGTYDGSFIKIYADGKLLDSTAASGTIDVNSYNFAAGAELNGCTGTFFGGSLDDIKIYNYARTPAQVAWDYNRGAPIAWYKMDECSGSTLHSTNEPYNSSLDATIYPVSNDNTSVGSCGSGIATEMWNDGSTGKFNGSLGFDGNDDYAQTTAPVTTQTSNISFSTWIYTTNNWGTIVPFYNGNAGADGYGFLISNGSCGNGSILSILTGGASCNATNSTYTVPTNQWIHAVGTYNGTTWKLYVNGVLNSSGSSTPGTPTTSTSVGNGLTGKIDDARIYNYALSDQQVKQIYNGGVAVSFK